MDSCKVCGGKDVNLVDGFYYCVECGTQDVNVQETIVEQTALGDGTFALSTVKKFTTAAKDGVEMSGEWHKWHIFNFILAGLTDELITLGAKPSVKMKVLWVWSRYVKHFQEKDAPQSKSKLALGDDVSDSDECDDMDTTLNGDKQDSGNDDLEEELNHKSKKSKSETFSKDIKIMSRSIILAILYVGLNLDRSDIQLSHLLRFVREGRLSLLKCMKFVPKELNIKAVKHWRNFVVCNERFGSLAVRALAMTCFKRLKLGVPLVPNLRRLVKNYIQELSLPGDMSDLVIGLMYDIPIDFLDLDLHTQKSQIRIPDYEGVCMSYILIALKMCFGIDGDYEVKLSEAVDKINEEENYLKSYKLGMFSEPCDRLFSFREWCQHLQFRKLMFCKYFLPMARHCNTLPDDYVFIEHLEKRHCREIKLSEEVTMDILNKIEEEDGDRSHVIPKNEFPITLTPMTSYVDVIARHVNDPDLRLLLCEDFTQYSIKYVVEDFKLPGEKDADNLIVGVNKFGKTFNNYVTGTLEVTEGDKTTVYIRNCENKNWLKTKPPTIEHVKRDSDEKGSDKDSDHGYDSNVENSVVSENLANNVANDKSVYEDKKLEILEVLDDKKSIFDDHFKDMSVSIFDGNVTIKEEKIDDFMESDAPNNISIHDSNFNDFDDAENRTDDENSVIQYNPDTFNREQVIAELIEQARKNYKIPLPKSSTIRELRKRKVSITNEKSLPSEPKKKKIASKPGEAKQEINNLISAYYNNLQSDVLNQISEQVKLIVGNIDDRNDLEKENVLDNTIDLGTNDQDDINDTVVSNSVQNDESQTEISTNHDGDVLDKNQDSNFNEADNVTIDDSTAEIVDEFSKSDPNFDEKEHDIKQLYVKIGDSLDNADISMPDLEDDPEIDKIIQKKIDEFANFDETLDKSKVNDVEDDDDSSIDDVPLSVLKGFRSYEQEKEERNRQVLDSLIEKPLHINKFKYWVRHYKSRSVERSTDMAKKFDLELNENLPLSFVFVIRECACMLSCSMFSLYRNLQNIEMILLD